MSNPSTTSQVTFPADDRLGLDVITADAEALSESDDGEGISALREAFEQWRSDLDAATAPAPWEDQDPATRQLDPPSVPDGLLSSLDVLGVSFTLDDLGDAAAVGVRTESGISGSLIGEPALPFFGPLYFLRDVDETVEVFVQSVSSGAEAPCTDTRAPTHMRPDRRSWTQGGADPRRDGARGRSDPDPPATS